MVGPEETQGDPVIEIRNRKIKLICSTAIDKKADEILILDMSERSALCDYFVVMSAPSTVRVRAIVDGIEESLEKGGYRVRHKEGYSECVWVLLDCEGVIVHVFHQPARQFYNLEHLWGDVPRKVYYSS